MDQANVATCAIIREEDADFGEMRFCEPQTQNLLPSQRLEEIDLSHLTEVEKQQLLMVLDKYAEVFSDCPGLYRGVKHSIPVTADFKPRRLKEYKIPEKNSTGRFTADSGLVESWHNKTF